MSDVADKWGEEVAQRGFAQIPNYLLLANQFLDPKLSPVELLVLVQLVGSWWRKDALPFPSVATLAQRCGVSSRQVQRALSSLEKRELLSRVARRSKGLIASNSYDLAPLASRLGAIAKSFPNAFPRKVRVPKGLESFVVPSVAPTPLPSNAIAAVSPIPLPSNALASVVTPPPVPDQSVPPPPAPDQPSSTAKPRS